MLNKLQKLCGQDGISGREDTIRSAVICMLPPYCKYHTDALGNLIVQVQGQNRAKNKVMLCAHMDEVGFIVRYITQDGYLQFDCVGGIDEKVVVGRQVCVGENRVPGVIGVKPVHLCDTQEQNVVPKVEKMVIDIGVDTREQAQKLVKLGDSVGFVSDFVRFGEGRIKAKAIDDRFGCAVLLELIKEKPVYDMCLVFSAQEEIGLRGAGVAAFSVAPDFALVLETTTASDIAGVQGAGQVCRLGQGAVVSYMDRSTLYDRELYRMAFALAEQNGIPIQTKTVIAGGNDAGAIHKSRGGVRTLTVSLPCRYLHSAGCVADEKDMKACLELAGLLSEAFINA